MSHKRDPDSSGNPAPLSCEELYEVAPDLALDLLDGTTRAAALAHLETCGNCRAEVARLTETATQALLAAPQVPPPAGFEQRVLSRLSLVETGPHRAAPEEMVPPSPRPRRQRSRRRSRAALAAAAMVVVVAGLVRVLAAGDPDPQTTVATMRTARGTVAGEVALQHAEPPVLDVDLTAWTDKWEQYEELVDGRLWLTVGVGDRREAHLLAPEASPEEAATAELTLPGTDADDVASVSVVDDAGRVWCSATLDPA